VLLKSVFNVLLALATSCVLSACGIVQAFSQPSFQFAKNDGANNAQDTASNCSSAVSDTPFQTWTDVYTNGQTDDTVLHWATQPGQSGTIGIYTGVIEGWQYAQPTSDAINAWYIALNGRLPDGHYLRMSPVEDQLNYQSDLIQMSVDTTNFDRSGVALTSFGTVTGPGTTNSLGNQSNSKDGFFIAGAQIVFNDQLVQQDPALNSNPTALYRLSMHEIGHALGLNHNPEKPSIMYPTADDTTCYSYGALPITQDTDNLISYYDPVVNSDENTPPPMPGGDLGNINLSSHTRKSFVTTKAVQPTSKTKRPNVENFMKSLSWIHGPTDGPVTVNYNKISIDTLVASSTLVAQAHLVRDVVSPTSKRFAPVIVTHEFVLDAVVSDFGAATGDTPAKAGDHVAVDEQMAYEDVPFADDPPVKPNTEAVLFLKPIVGSRARQAAGHRALQYTAPFVSKWIETRDGRVYASTNSRTLVARQLTGKTLSLALQGNRRQIAAASKFAVDPRADILSARGISVISESQKFRRDPFAVLVENARYDGAVTKGNL